MKCDSHETDYFFSNGLFFDCLIQFNLNFVIIRFNCVLYFKCSHKGADIVCESVWAMAQLPEPTWRDTDAGFSVGALIMLLSLMPRWPSALLHQPCGWCSWVTPLLSHSVWGAICQWPLLQNYNFKGGAVCRHLLTAERRRWALLQERKATIVLMSDRGTVLGLSLCLPCLDMNNLNIYLLSHNHQHSGNLTTQNQILWSGN